MRQTEIRIYEILLVLKSRYIIWNNFAIQDYITVYAIVQYTSYLLYVVLCYFYNRLVLWISKIFDRCLQNCHNCRYSQLRQLCWSHLKIAATRISKVSLNLTEQFYRSFHLIWAYFTCCLWYNLINIITFICVYIIETSHAGKHKYYKKQTNTTEDMSGDFKLYTQWQANLFCTRLKLDQKGKRKHS